mgnify:CR=1 FL=1
MLSGFKRSTQKGPKSPTRRFRASVFTSSSSEDEMVYSGAAHAGRTRSKPSVADRGGSPYVSRVSRPLAVDIESDDGSDSDALNARASLNRSDQLIHMRALAEADSLQARMLAAHADLDDTAVSVLDARGMQSADSVSDGLTIEPASQVNANARLISAQLRRYNPFSPSRYADTVLTHMTAQES